MTQRKSPVPAAGQQRRRGEGSIYYDTVNRAWGVSFSVPSPSPGRPSKRLKRTLRTEGEAKRVLAEWQRMHGIGLDLSEDPTLAEYLEDYIAYVLPVTRPNVSTRENHIWALRYHVTPRIGHIKLRGLRYSHVEGVLKEMAGGGSSQSTINRVRANLVVALRHAQRKDLVERNVAELADLPPLPAKQIAPQKTAPFTDEDLARIMRVIGSDPYEALWLVQLWAGCRPGEAAALGLGSCDWDQMAIHISQSRTRRDGHLGIGPAKTARSVRSLVVLDEVIEALLRAKTLPEELRRKAGTRWEENGLLFPSRRGTVLDPSNQRRLLAKLLKAAGVTNHYTPYSFRHTFATRFANDGDMPIEHLAPYMGHVDSRMLERVYIHPLRGLDERGLEPGGRVYDQVMRLVEELAPEEDEVPKVVPIKKRTNKERTDPSTAAS